MGWRTPLAWSGFFLALITGAVLLSMRDPAARAWGATVMVLLAVGLIGLALAHYAGQRRKAKS